MAYYHFCLSSQVAKCYFAQIVHAISYCHQLHVVHRDLKPENVVFFEKQGVVKLTDFGFSNRFQPGKTLNTSCGSLAYSAPEILLGDEYDAPAVGTFEEPTLRELWVTQWGDFYTDQPKLGGYEWFYFHKNRTLSQSLTVFIAAEHVTCCPQHIGLVN